MAADTFSNVLGFLVMGTGNDNNTWGDNANASIFALFEDNIAGLTTEPVTGGTLDLSGSPPPAGPTQAASMFYLFTGILLADQTVIVPNLSKAWVVNNATTGAFALKYKTPSGTAVVVPQGTWSLVWCDGSNVINVIGLGPLLQQGKLNWTTAGGTSDVITATYNPPFTSLVDGMLLFVRASAANGTINPTFAPDGLTAHTITRSGGQPLAVGDITGVNDELILRYNLANTRWELLNPETAAIPNLSISTQKLIDRAVSYPKMQNETTNTLLGNVTGASAPPQEITLGAGLTITGTTGGVGAFTFTGGTGYTDGTYAGVALSGGAGSGAQATLIVSGGIVVSVVITAPGTGYLVGNVLGGSGFGSGSGFALTVAGNLVNPTIRAAAPRPGPSGQLVVTVVDNTHVTIQDPGGVIVTDGVGNYMTVLPTATQLNFGTNGGVNALQGALTITANTGYYLWVIAKPDGTTANLANTSSTTVSFPTGYTMAARVGWVRTAVAAANLMGSLQYGSLWKYAVGVAACTGIPASITGAAGNPAGTPPSMWVAAPTVASLLVPATAKAVDLVLQYGAQSGQTSVCAAPNSSYGTISSASNPPPLAFSGFQTAGAGLNSNAASQVMARFAGPGPFVYASSGAPNGLYVDGFEDNVL